MSYKAKRIILLFMLWGLTIFTAVHVRLALTDSPPTQASSISLDATPTVAPDRASQLQAALENNPNDLAATVELAEMFFAGQDYESARLLYERARLLSPNSVDILLKLGMSQLYTLQFNEAVTTLQQAVNFDPNRAESHLLLGLALSRMEPPQMALARSEWLTAKRLDPNSETAKQAQSLLDGAVQQ